MSADDGHSPLARITVQRGKLNDVLTLHAEHFKPNTGFDLFNGEHKAGPAVMSLLPFLHFSEPPPACLITRN